MDFDTHNGSKRAITQRCAFLGSDQWLTKFRGSNFPNTGNNGFL